MTEPDVFPNLDDGSTHEEPWDHRFAPLAEILGCSIEEATDAFIGLEFPEYGTREHLNVVKDSVERHNRALRPAQKLAYYLRRLTAREKEHLRWAGAVTPEQVEHLSQVLSGQVDSLNGWYTGQDRTGGRNVAAHTIAEGVRRAFRRKRKRISYGESDGSPSTNFGRAVELTIAAFGVRADWAEPAHKAWLKQQDIGLRLGRLKATKQRRINEQKRRK